MYSQRRKNTTNSNGCVNLRLAKRGPADPKEHVFFSLENDAQCIESLLAEGEGCRKVLFFRAGVAAGKTTMAKYLAQQKSDKYVLIEHPKTYTFDGWKDTIIKAHKACGLPETWGKYGQCSSALRSFAEAKKTLIFDDGHVTMECSQLERVLFKDRMRETHPNIIIFSTLGRGFKTGPVTLYDYVGYDTPPKYLWQPTVPHAHMVVPQLAAAGILLKEKSVQFMFNLCNGHFGIVMHAFRWIRQQQQRSKHRQPWDLATTVKIVRSSLAFGWDYDPYVPGAADSLLSELSRCRAVVPRRYSPCVGRGAHCVPPAFAGILFGGYNHDKRGVEKETRELRMKGMLMPLRESHLSEPFTRLSGTSYGVPPLMSDYYQHAFKKFHLKTTETLNENTCTSMLLRVVPYLSFLNLIRAPLTLDDGLASAAVMSGNNFPHKLYFQMGLWDQFSKMDDGKSTFSVRDDEADLLVRSHFGRFLFAFQLVMASSTPKEQESTLAQFTDICQVGLESARKCLIIIGPDHTTVKKRLLAFPKTTFELELVGLVPSARFDSYTVFVPDRWHDPNHHARVSVPVDGIPRTENGGRVYSRAKLIETAKIQAIWGSLRTME